MIDLFLSNKKIAVFLEQKKKKSQITANRPSSESGQIATFWLKDFVNTNLKIILEYNF